MIEGQIKELGILEVARDVLNGLREEGETPEYTRSQVISVIDQLTTALEKSASTLSTLYKLGPVDFTQTYKAGSPEAHAKKLVEESCFLVYPRWLGCPRPDV